MIPKIYFFIEATFNKRDYHRFGVELFKRHAYEVYIYNFTPLFKKEYLKYTSPDPIEYDKQVSILNFEEAYRALSKIKNYDVIISMMYPNYNNRFIFEYLEEKGLRFGYVFAGVIPFTIISGSSFLSNLKTALSKPYKVIKVLKSFFNDGQLKKKFYPKFIIYGGANTVNYSRFVKNNETKLIKAHSFDYDRFLEENQIIRKTKPKNHAYAVFLDELVPHHPDYLVSNLKLYCDADTYYASLNWFFKEFEDFYGLKILIAAHPRYNYKIIGNPFDNRSIILGQTVSLVRNARMVLAHSSTSISFAVLYKKPLLFLIHKDYSHLFKFAITHLARQFEKSPFDISSDKFNFDVDIFKVDEEIYVDYKEKYIKEFQTPNKFFWEIFIDYLKS
jgi:hypothetical protein